MVTQVARAFSTSVTPVIERQVKESISKNLIPSSAMHQELSREIRSEILNLKKEVLAWQGDALRSQEVRQYRKGRGLVLTGSICSPSSASWSSPSVCSPIKSSIS